MGTNVHIKNITSRNNDAVKIARSLVGDRKERSERGLFVTDGVKLCVEALNGGMKLQTVFFTDSVQDKRPDVLERFLSLSPDAYRITDDIASKVSDTRAPQGLFCVWAIPDSSFKAARFSSRSKLIFACGLRDPGNLGAIIRSCEAFGTDALILSDCPDIFSPKLLRASAGGVFRLAIMESLNTLETISLLKSAGIRVYAAVPSDSGMSVTDIEMSAGVAFLIGGEGSGLPNEAIEASDGCALIPMSGGAQSLNAAAAASIIAWEIQRRRTQEGER